LLNIQKPVVFSSNLNVNAKKTVKLVEICKKLGAQIYLSGSGGRNYLDENLFLKEGITVEWQYWLPPKGILYDKWRNLDWRNISFLDFIARYGPDMLKNHLEEWVVAQ
jgi:hypothetical protein